MKETFNSFEKSLHRLRETLTKEKTIIHRDASIKRFEFTAELAWKLIQKFLRKQEIICRSPKECLEEAFKFGLILDDPKWLEMIKDRNLTAHTYDEKTAQEIYHRLPKYLDCLDSLKSSLKTHLKNL
ncbi:MAG: nucleotidyltransferase substrate binding protein [Candidatus Magasanikbacteria bacterium]|nr:nucleotidyltransferase substrate binding protein [Candidatus Magasanikbacteria bacterium]